MVIGPRGVNAIGQPKSHTRRGLMLVECLLALVILPLAVVAVAYAIVAGQQQAAETLRQEKAVMLAEGLLEEVLSLPYDPSTDNALGAEESDRWAYDSPTDYHGFAESAHELKWLDRVNAETRPYPNDLQYYDRSVDVSFCECGGTGGDACDASLCETFSSDSPIRAKTLTVTVTVSDTSGDVVTLQRTLVAQTGT